MKLVSFGYRYLTPTTGPLGADIIFDARCLKEDPAEKELLGPLTGKDKAVQDYLKDLIDVRRFIAGMHGIDVLAQPTRLVAVGCHSGRHRSVYIVETVAHLLNSLGHEISVEHLDINRPHPVGDEVLEPVPDIV